jgi:hypothetical protein
MRTERFLESRSSPPTSLKPSFRGFSALFLESLQGALSNGKTLIVQEAQTKFILKGRSV